MRKRYLALWCVFILLFATLCAGCAEQAPVLDENGRPSLETIPVTELPTEEPTEKPTEPPTEPSTEAPTEPPTEPPTEKPTEAPTEPPTEKPTEPPTEPPTAPPTEPHLCEGAETPLGKNEKGYAFLKVCRECGDAQIVYYDALLTFVDDDAKTQAMLHWEKIIDATGITMTAAVIPGKVGETTVYDCWFSYSGWDLLEKMRDKGVDFVNHTYNHYNLTTLTEEQIRLEMTMAKDSLREHGIESNILVYPFNKYNDLVTSVADDYFTAAFTCENQIITDINTKKHALYRMHLNDKSVSKEVLFEDGTVVFCNDVKPLKKLQSELQCAVQSKGWLVYMAHAYNSPAGQYFFDEGSEQIIIDYCRYAQSMGNVKIVNLTQGYAANADFKES